MITNNTLHTYIASLRAELIPLLEKLLGELIIRPENSPVVNKILQHAAEWPLADLTRLELSDATKKNLYDIVDNIEEILWYSEKPLLIKLNILLKHFSDKKEIRDLKRYMLRLVDTLHASAGSFSAMPSVNVRQTFARIDNDIIGDFCRSLLTQNENKQNAAHKRASRDLIFLEEYELLNKLLAKASKKVIRYAIQEIIAQGKNVDQIIQANFINAAEFSDEDWLCALAVGNHRALFHERLLALHQKLANLSDAELDTLSPSYKNKNEKISAHICQILSLAGNQAAEKKGNYYYVEFLIKYARYELAEFNRFIQNKASTNSLPYVLTYSGTYFSRIILFFRQNESSLSAQDAKDLQVTINALINRTIKTYADPIERREYFESVFEQFPTVGKLKPFFDQHKYDHTSFVAHEFETVSTQPSFYVSLALLHDVLRSGNHEALRYDCQHNTIIDTQWFSQDECGFTPLMMVCLRGEVTLAKMILDKANHCLDTHQFNEYINLVNDEGFSALMLSVLTYNVELVKLLLHHHANPNLQINDNINDDTDYTEYGYPLTPTFTAGESALSMAISGNSVNFADDKYAIIEQLLACPNIDTQLLDSNNECILTKILCYGAENIFNLVVNHPSYKPSNSLLPFGYLMRASEDSSTLVDWKQFCTLLLKLKQIDPDKIMNSLNTKQATWGDEECHPLVNILSPGIFHATNCKKWVELLLSLGANVDLTIDCDDVKDRLGEKIPPHQKALSLLELLLLQYPSKSLELAELLLAYDAPVSQFALSLAKKIDEAFYEKALFHYEISHIPSTQLATFTRFYGRVSAVNDDASPLSPPPQTVNDDTSSLSPPPLKRFKK